MPRRIGTHPMYQRVYAAPHRYLLRVSVRRRHAALVHRRGSTEPPGGPIRTFDMTPEDVIAQLRAMGSKIDDLTPLTQEQRTLLKQRRGRHPAFVVEASINVIGVLDNLSQAIGQPLDDVRRMQDDTLRWDAAIDEARAFLRGLEGANLIRQQLALIGM